MELETQNDDVSSWSSATNWSVAGGSLVNRVTFESSLSPIDIDTSAGPPLILHPPSPDSGPCEITINFTQKQDVQQIYVRSTARVYEIYYAPDIHSDNEYLCTVHCGIAARDEEVLHTADNEEVCLENLSESFKGMSAENLRNGNKSSTREDDWVEVKVPDSHALDKKTSSLPVKFVSEQALYEATAQMSDVDPCISLTLRLLSLERKDCVFVDEIYVFADPSDSADSENQAKAERSAGSSLMAMFMPTLLQLSKARSGNQTQDSQMVGSKASDSSSAAMKIQTDNEPSISNHQEVKFQDASRDTYCGTQTQIPLGVSITENNSDTAYHHVELSMDHLFSRMDRIEDLLLKFEEKMVKPISNIEARLERVEQQLEVLNKQSQNSGLSTYSRFCAPSSCIESDSNSFYNSGNDCPSCEAVILGNNDAQSEALSSTPNYMSDSVNPSKLVPGLAVTAPEFSSDDEEEEDQSSGVMINPSQNSPRPVLTIDDEEEEDQSSGVMTNPSQNSPRPVLTIDDALASALAGFMSLTSTQPERYTRTFFVKAPEFLNEEDSSSDSKASARVEEIGTEISMSLTSTQTQKSTQTFSVKAPEFLNEENEEDISPDSKASARVEEVQTEPFICSVESNGLQNVKDSSAVSSINSSYSEENVERYNDEHSFKPGMHHEGIEEDKPDCKSGENAVDLANHGMAQTDVCQITEEIENRVVSTEISNIANLDKTDIPKGLPQKETEDALNDPQDGANTKVTNENSDRQARVVTEENSDEDVLKNVLKFSRASSVVDFEIPMLDVKFTSLGSCEAPCSLAALLSESSELVTEAPSVRESDTPPVSEESSLILVEDGESVSPAHDGYLSVDMDFYTVAEPLNTWGANLQYETSNSHETFAASLI